MAHASGPAGPAGPSEPAASARALGAVFRPLRRRTALAVGLFFGLAAFAAGMVFPNPTPQFDEFFHLLVTRSLRAGEGFRITPEAEPYDRAWLFSYAVYLAQAVFGPNLTAARIPSALCWALTLGGVACWLARRVGLAAAAVAAALLGFSVHSLMYSTMIRFYTPQALCVWVGAVCVESLVPRLRATARSGGQEPTRPERRGVAPDGGGRRDSLVRAAGLMLAGAVAAVVGFSLQPTTLIAVAAAGVWLLAAWLCWLTLSTGRPLHRWLAGAGTVATVTLTAVFLWVVVVRAYFEYVTAGTRIWAAGEAANPWYYHDVFSAWYAALWPLLPLWAVMACLRGGPESDRRRRVVYFLLVMGVLPVVIHSLVPTKAFRYVFYALPFLFSIVAIGVAESARLALVVAPKLGEGRPPVIRRGILAAAVGALVLASAYGVRRSPGLTRGVAAATGLSDRAPYARANWQAALPVLGPAAERADVIGSSVGMKALYWLGRLDFNLSEAVRLDPDPDWLQPQDGRPVRTEPEELRAIRNEHASGLIVIETAEWRQPAFVSDAAADELEASFVRLPMDPDHLLLAFGWGEVVEAFGDAEAP